MDYLAIIGKLSGFLNLAPYVAKMISDYAAQSGKTVDEIISDTLIGLDETDAKALADMAKEQAAIDGGAA